MAEFIASLSARTVELLGLTLKPGTPIFIGEENLEHMRKNHPEDYQNYSKHIADIIKNPHYVSKHPKDGSIQYIKELDSRVLVAVRTTQSGKLFVRTLFSMNPKKWENYVNSGYILKY
ncbi:PBECR3 domain-containing polyvalent protein [Paenibacillus rubinfantis]|uniref:PBECR3 domain-containing polyvalent protein n=1 Tax=Paenibacillus rubinfantis TaxID=1720296 RepID=UPI00073E5E8D|nr:PBECR2 nuclease fold domain-containing protein [Paenibacillus rubinfantis]